MTVSAVSKLDKIEKSFYRLVTDRDERAQYLASPEPGEDLAINPEAVKIYSSLIEIGRFDLMSSIYPITKELLGKQFRSLVCDYFETIPSDHFNLNQSARQFSQYLSTCQKLISRYPFLSELADYEWIELAVLEDSAADVPVQQNLDSDAIDPASFAATVPIIVGALALRRYAYNIPALIESIEEGSKIARSLKKQSAYVIVYRDPVSLEARFLEVGEVALTLLETIKLEPDTTYGDLLKQACGRDPANASSLLAGCLEAIEQFKKLKLIVAEK